MYLFRELRNRKRGSGSNRNHDVQIITKISDLICDYLQKMSPLYITFCSGQLSAAKLIQHKTENDQNFNEMAKKCSQDPRSNRLPLISYLLKPTQRITKYPLLVKKILNHTPEDHVDYEKCLEALKLAENLCNNVNEACRAREDSEKLNWIQKHVRCDGLDQIITFNSNTNCLGNC